MKLPKALVITAGMLAAGIFFLGAFLYFAIRNKSLLGAISAGVAAASSAFALIVMDNICRLASFSPREFFDMDKKISDFFSTGEDAPVRAPAGTKSRA